MKYFDRIIGRHDGRPAIVICGGPSAPKQLKEILGKVSEPVLISVNEHGCKIQRCDYAVSLDNIHKKVAEFETERITPYNWADIKLTGHWNASNSGRTACWVAWKLGCTPIIVVGADLYQTGSYWWNPNAPTSGKNQKFEQHLKEWQVVPHRVPAEILTAAGGPLVEHGVMPKFDGRRKYPTVDYGSPRSEKSVNGKAPTGQKIRILKPCWIEGQQYDIGEEPVVRPRSVRQVVGAGKAQHVN